jgi:IclR family pca regulon transcriptional regulator
MLSEMPTAPEIESSDYVQALARGLAAIRAFGPDRQSMSLSEVAASTQLTRATARRSLLTLCRLGYASLDGRRYSHTARVLELGYGYLSSLRLPELAFPLMERLSQRVQQSCSIAVLDGDEIAYVQRVSIRKVMAISLAVGARLPAYATSMGRVLLAALPEAELEAWLKRQKLTTHTAWTLIDRKALREEIGRVRKRGFALIEQELEAGLCSIAVPLRGSDGRTMAALNVGMPWHKSARVELERRILPALRECAVGIETVLRQARIR